MSLESSLAEAGHLAVAVGLTYALGFERDLRGAPTGDRVFALIGAGAGVIGIISSHGAPNALAGAVTGVGFIGGGLLFRQSIGQSQVLTGITTAATIFAATAIGAAAGEGYLLIATLATVLALFVLEVRHIKMLSFLDGRHWASRFSNDNSDPIDPHLPGDRPQDRCLTRRPAPQAGQARLPSPRPPRSRPARTLRRYAWQGRGNR
jgi:putative Mg2+ transporter-C (MgtC) family protein